MSNKEEATPSGKPVVHVPIGGFSVTRVPTVLQTVLGSCVSACLYDTVHRVAGMIHLLLPGKVAFFAFDESSCYGIGAMQRLINEITNRGGSQACLEAKIFGGGHILSSASLANSTGIKNVEFLENFLHMEKIPLISQDTGGSFTRRVFFHTDSFEVSVEKIAATEQFEVSAEEEELFKKVQEQIRKPSDIEFF
ncbi:MAG: chemotaxis protein CheD [Candidatus Riflebacteria bacterium]|nr:chemotaxis protein CheD [Candidatus Riflebacteria bacterium]